MPGGELCQESRAVGREFLGNFEPEGNMIFVFYRDKLWRMDLEGRRQQEEIGRLLQDHCCSSID